MVATLRRCGTSHNLYHLYELSLRLRKVDVLRSAFAPIPFPALPTAEQREQDPEAAEKTLNEFRGIGHVHSRAEQGNCCPSEPPLTVPVGKGKDELVAVCRGD